MSEDICPRCRKEELYIVTHKNYLGQNEMAECKHCGWKINAARWNYAWREEITCPYEELVQARQNPTQ